jgi:predicted metal-dependent hydrolase
LVWAQAEPRSVRLSDDALTGGGPEQGFPRRVEAFLKRLALETMSREVAEFAAVAGVTPRRVSIGDAATRWGSCSSAGAIRLSWRLILAPPRVRRYVVAHEVAHLRHLDHGAEFKALEARLFGPGLAAAKSDLRRLGPRFRLLGRG